MSKWSNGDLWELLHWSFCSVMEPRHLFAFFPLGNLWEVCCSTQLALTLVTGQAWVYIHERPPVFILHHQTFLRFVAQSFNCLRAAAKTMATDKPIFSRVYGMLERLKIVWGRHFYNASPLESIRLLDVWINTAQVWILHLNSMSACSFKTTMRAFKSNFEKFSNLFLILSWKITIKWVIDFIKL